MTAAQRRSGAFWERIEAQLAETDAEIAVERDAFYSQPEWDVFRMSYTTAGDHRLFAWLSVPHGDGPFPALVRMPDYASVHDIIYTPVAGAGRGDERDPPGTEEQRRVGAGQLPGSLDGRHR